MSNKQKFIPASHEEWVQWSSEPREREQQKGPDPKTKSTKDLFIPGLHEKWVQKWSESKGRDQQKETDSKEKNVEDLEHQVDHLTDQLEKARQKIKALQVIAVDAFQHEVSNMHDSGTYHLRVDCVLAKYRGLIDDKYLK